MEVACYDLKMSDIADRFLVSARIDMSFYFGEPKKQLRPALIILWRLGLRDTSCNVHLW